MWDPNIVVVDDYNFGAKNEADVLVLLFNVTISRAKYLQPRSNIFLLYYTFIHPSSLTHLYLHTSLDYVPLCSARKIDAYIHVS